MKRINETITDVFINVDTNEMFFTWRGEQYTGQIIHTWHEESAHWTRLDGVEVHVSESYLYRVDVNNNTYDILQQNNSYKIVWDHEREL